MPTTETDLQAPDPRVLTLDGPAGTLHDCDAILRGSGYQTHHCMDLECCLEALRRESQRHVALLARLDPGGLSAARLVGHVHAIHPQLPIVLIAERCDCDTVIALLRRGVADVVPQSALPNGLLRALERLRLQMPELTHDAPASTSAIGSSPKFLELLELVDRVAASRATVLLSGESGSGKDLIAQRLHAHSDRAKGRFVKLSCAALPPTLLESELFGHERGAFTDAHRQKPGRFELADGGTLFLDEIGDIPLAMQVKLLRFLQEGSFERLGGSRTLHADVRIIAATHRDLIRLVRAQEFREDLYYRLAVIRIHVPPLRERPQDILALAQHFALQAAKRNARALPALAPDFLDELRARRWRGNVRELENAIERAVVLARDDVLRAADLPAETDLDHQLAGEGALLSFELGTPLHEIEERMIDEALRAAEGNHLAAARLLGISSRTVNRRLAARRDWRSALSPADRTEPSNR